MGETLPLVCVFRDKLLTKEREKSANYERSMQGKWIEVTKRGRVRGMPGPGAGGGRLQGRGGPTAGGGGGSGEKVERTKLRPSETKAKMNERPNTVVIDGYEFSVPQSHLT